MSWSRASGNHVLMQVRDRTATPMSTLTLTNIEGHQGRKSTMDVDLNIDVDVNVRVHVHVNIGVDVHLNVKLPLTLVLTSTTPRRAGRRRHQSFSQRRHPCPASPKTWTPKSFQKLWKTSKNHVKSANGQTHTEEPPDLGRQRRVLRTMTSLNFKSLRY